MGQNDLKGIMKKMKKKGHPLLGQNYKIKWRFNKKSEPGSFFVRDNGGNVGKTMTWAGSVLD